MQASVEEGLMEVNDYRLNNVWHEAEFWSPLDVSQTEHGKNVDSPCREHPTSGIRPC